MGRQHCDPGRHEWAKTHDEFDDGMYWYKCMICGKLEVEP